MPNTPTYAIADLGTALLLLSLPTLTAGDVVTYHGSHTEYHGVELVVEEVDKDGRMRLVDRHAGRPRLHEVRRASVRPTGDVVDMCDDCGHILEAAVKGRTYCARPGCGCRKHGNLTTPPISKAAEHLLVAITRAVRRLRTGAEQTAADIETLAIGFDGARFAVRAAAGAEVEALVRLARYYITDCPELGITRERLNLALADDLQTLFAK